MSAQPAAIAGQGAITAEGRPVTTSEEGAAPLPRVVVLDHGSGNVRSVVRALEAAGADVTLTADRAQVLAADGVVVPGVGAYAATMDQLRAVDGPGLIERRLAGGRPVLGICVGLQVMFEAGREHGVRSEGLGQWPGEVTALEADVVPHMGWNTVEVAAGSRLFAGVADERFYFVHSYAARAWLLEPPGRMLAPQVSWSVHDGDRFVAAVEHGPLTATQFHPEKSGAAGAQLLRNWLAALPGGPPDRGVAPGAPVGTSTSDGASTSDRASARAVTGSAA